MPYDPQKHHRRSIRLNGYDYAQPGAYFVTMVTHQRQDLFGDIVDDEMVLSPLGKIVRYEWLRSINIRKEILLHDDEFVVMPNYFHDIVWIVDVRADGVRPGEDHPILGARCAHQPDAAQAPTPQRKPKSLGSFIAGFKSSVTSRARQELSIYTVR